MDITEKNASVLLTRAVAKLRKRFDVVNA
jgi:hypothetical protein